MPAMLADRWAALGPELQSLLIVTLQVVAVLLAVVVAVAMLTLAERKVIGYMQLRRGPNRISFFGVPVLHGFDNERGVFEELRHVGLAAGELDESAYAAWLKKCSRAASVK